MVTTLPNGRRILIRPIRPDDKQLLVEGLAKASAATIYKRFLSARKRFTAGELRYLTEVDRVDHVALIAVPLDNPCELAGVGRFVRDAQDPDSAEVAVLVGDCLQGMGLGTTIGRALADEARPLGIKHFTATMLPDNRAAYQLLGRITEHLHSRFHEGVREIVGDVPMAA